MSVLTVDGSLEPKGFQQIADLGSAVGLSPPAGARLALIQATDQDVRWRDDGTDPTASVGVQLRAGDDLWYTGDVSVISLIEQSSGATVNVSYYGG